MDIVSSWATKPSKDGGEAPTAESSQATERIRTCPIVHQLKAVTCPMTPNDDVTMDASLTRAARHFRGQQNLLHGVPSRVPSRPPHAARTHAAVSCRS